MNYHHYHNGCTYKKEPIHMLQKGVIEKWQNMSYCIIFYLYTTTNMSTAPALNVSLSAIYSSPPPFWQMSVFTLFFQQ